MNDLLERLLREKTITAPSGKVLNANIGVSRTEVNLLQQLVRDDPTIHRTLEVGCALGFSSLAICDALSGRDGAHHHMLDPFQMTAWEGVGVSHLRQAGFENFTLIPELSEFGLPRLAEAQPASFDLVLVDGFHTFDHTMIDVFYANRLLRVGGTLVIDDVAWPGVAKVVAYVSQYPAYEVVASIDRGAGLKRLVAGAAAAVARGPVQHAAPLALVGGAQRWAFGTMVALRKVVEDERPVNWFRAF